MSLSGSPLIPLNQVVAEQTSVPWKTQGEGKGHAGIFGIKRNSSHGTPPVPSSTLSLSYPKPPILLLLPTHSKLPTDNNLLFAASPPSPLFLIHLLILLLLLLLLFAICTYT